MILLVHARSLLGCSGPLFFLPISLFYFSLFCIYSDSSSFFQLHSLASASIVSVFYIRHGFSALVCSMLSLWAYVGNGLCGWLKKYLRNSSIEILGVFEDELTSSSCVTKSQHISECQCNNSRLNTSSGHSSKLCEQPQRIGYSLPSL